MKAPLVLASLLVLSIAVPLASATHAGACTRTVTVLKVKENVVGYRDQRIHPDGFGGGHARDVVYLESNGVPGLQSGGSDLAGSLFDPCWEGANHDQLLVCRRGCSIP